MAEKGKVFNIKAYAIAVFCVILAILVVITAITFKSKYTGFYPEEVAKTYVDTIAQSGDGYNSYKNALPSKNFKYGDFIRTYYMNPVIYRDAGWSLEADLKKLKGYNDKSYMGESTKNDDGTLQGQVIDAMYPYYTELIENGWDNYDTIFTEYITKLVEVRRDVFGDDYMTDEIIFTALEANVKAYGESLTGTKDVVDKNSGVQISKKSIGVYQTAYGEDYKFTTTAKNSADLDLEAYKTALDEELLKTYKISADDITAAKTVDVEVTTADGTVVADATVIVVKIKSFWYVDNIATVTDELYGFYK